MVPATAQDYAGRVVREVNIEGLQRVSPQLVRGQLEVQPGEPYNPRATARDLRRLHGLGYFATIRVEAEPVQDEVVITYICEERRVIRDIQIIGADQIRPAVVRETLSWSEGQTFNPEEYEEERLNVLGLYEERGLPAATVEIIVEEVGPAEIAVTYVIDEGARARIRSIDFQGNETLSSRDLRGIMDTRRAWWFLGGRYDEDQFEFDLENIIEAYGDVGHLEAEIPGVDLQYSEDGRNLYITVFIEEGPQYQVETLDIANNIVYADEEVRGIIAVQEGSIHNRGQIQADADLVQEGYSDSGYVEAVVTPEVTLDQERHTTNVVHHVHEGDLRYVREIRITGNEVTRDEVIRRHLMVLPGDRFDGSAVRMSQRALDNTDYFDAVRFNIEPVEDDPRFMNLLLDVEEANTGEFGFGMGFSPEDGIGGFTNLRLRNFDITNWDNFTGAGQQFAARINIGQRRSEYTVSFTDPHIGGYPLAFGVDVFDESVRHRGGIRFREDTTGAQIRLGKALSPYVNAHTSLRYSRVRISDLPFFTARQLRLQRGGSTTISNTWGISRNTVDREHDPSQGSRHDLAAEIAGLGGDNHFLKLQHDSTWYTAVGERDQFVFSFRTREGWVTEYGSSDFVPLSDRFYAGGTTTVRGYRNRAIGPRERRFIFFGEHDIVGGNVRLVNNAEVKYRMTDQFRLYAFADGGGVWEDASDFDFGGMRFSAGIGFGVDVPRLGPVRLDYAMPINPDRFQSSSGRLHFQTGLSF